jgi:hypothetical protein
MAEVEFICEAVNRVEVDRFIYRYGPHAEAHAERCSINAQLRGDVLSAAKYMKICEVLAAESKPYIFAGN